MSVYICAGDLILDSLDTIQFVLL